jgi:uncharacterized phage infection (PIP) family protein YhgE
MSQDQDNAGWLVLMAMGAAAAAYFLKERSESGRQSDAEAKAFRELNRASNNPMLGFDMDATQRDFENLRTVYQAERSRQLEKEHGALYQVDPSLQAADRALVELESCGNDLDRLHEAMQNYTQTANDGIKQFDNLAQQQGYYQPTIDNGQYYQGQAQQAVCQYCSGRRTFLCPTCGGRTQEYGLQSSSGNDAIDALMNLKKQIDCRCKTCIGIGIVACPYCFNR